MSDQELHVARSPRDDQRPTTSPQVSKPLPEPTVEMPRNVIRRLWGLVWRPSWLSAALVVALYYLAYRYPFKISSSLTSPTYGDTPVWLMVTKYALIGVIAVALLVRSFTAAQRRISRPVWILLAVLAVLAVFAGVRAILLDSSDLLEICLFLGAGIPIAMFIARVGIDAASFERILTVFAVVTVLVDAIQVGIFAFTGRLPALAYANSLSVRFGSVWDDPNGFGFMIALLLPIVFLCVRHKGFKIAILLLLIAELILTQSLTAMTAVTVAMALAGVLLLRRPCATAIGVVSFAAVVTALGFLLKALSPPSVVSAYVAGKSGSVAGHLKGVTVVKETSFLDYLGLGAHIKMAESGYVSIAANLGIPFLVGYVAIGVVAIWKCYSAIRRSETWAASPLHVGVLTFLVAYLLGSANLDLPVIFPVDFFYVLCACISFVQIGRWPGAARNLRKLQFSSAR